ncbi:hypothetical protein EFY87_15975 [Flexivirga caeni]|uniref:Uncharacterized protein n=1 Tax=Flexivirga caeni TaxID=2294115 RepID=A0A3M9M322_9MICO|nr:hypothetical protein EFY87_15975 [Flexivirga caeni]
MVSPSPVAPQPGSIRALIEELAQLEDAVRSVQRQSASTGAGAEQVLDPQLLELLKREAQIVAALRRARHRGSLPDSP